ncbi:MAG: PEP-utilizing enzyme [Oscillospiraceae bacterium]|nr:PEP-utilizing enzyme [Oscillospiraceae bacterium]
MNCILQHIAPSPETVGGKAYHLEQLTQWGMPVPEWTVLPTECFTAFLGEHIDSYRALMKENSEESHLQIIELLEHCTFSDAFCQQLAMHIQTLFGENVPLAVRSSAVDEDSNAHSFAGMMDSFLNVCGTEQVLTAIRKCYQSCFSRRAMEYRRKNQLLSEDIRAAVIIQRMIPAEYAGVIFTTEPRTNNPDEMLVSAARGLGEELVSGAADSSDYVLDSAGKVIWKQENTLQLTEKILYRLHQLAKKIESKGVLRIAQDIEYCVQDDTVYILQTRPVAAYRTIDKNAERTVLDNSNIIESYSGATTPLTFSFAREVYSKIYRQTLRTFCVSEEAIQSISDDLDHMLCFYENKIYYRMNSWYRMTALYPGYQKNKRYMENMMGVKMTVQESERGAKTRMIRIYVRFIRKMLRMKKDSALFLQRFSEVTAPYYGNHFSGMSNQEALAVYDRLEHEILDDFITPIANDMGAMVFFGMLTDQLKKQNIADYEGLLSSVISKQGNVESAEQSAAVLDIVKMIQASEKLKALFLQDYHEIQTQLKNYPQVHSKIEAYIHRFGPRIMDELKLETVTLFEDPSFLYDTIRGYLQWGEQPRNTQSENENVEQLLLKRFGIWKRPLIRFLLQLTKFFIRNRESLRLRRTYIYSIIRSIYLRIGENLADSGLLEHPRDIFYLEKSEIAEIVEGSLSDKKQIRQLAAERKAAFLSNQSKKVYDRMYFYGALEPQNMLPVYIRQETTGGNVLRGVAGGGGVVTGKVKYVESPSNVHLEGGILMAKRTDPGWTVLFPMAGAVLIEHGSILSHSAVIAREMGIPLVAGIRGLTDYVKDGMLVRVDGIQGTVEILNEENR